MGYGDFMPSGGHHAKKPLTKAQMRKIQQAYKHADSVSAAVKKKEQEEQEHLAGEVDDILKLL